jgi:uncharacterized protein
VGSNPAGHTSFDGPFLPDVHLAKAKGPPYSRAMTDPIVEAETPASIDDMPLSPIEAGYRNATRLSMAITVLPLLIGALALDWLVIAPEFFMAGPLTAIAIILALWLIVVVPGRQYQRWGYTLGSDMLRVARGYLFHTDTIVPFVRVQHIDVGQGPIERMFGVSHLVVHTAGTDNSIVTLPGLAPDRAADMRETIRRHIQTDFA